MGCYRYLLQLQTDYIIYAIKHYLSCNVNMLWLLSVCKLKYTLRYDLNIDASLLRSYPIPKGSESLNVQWIHAPCICTGYCTSKFLLISSEDRYNLKIRWVKKNKLWHSFLKYMYKLINKRYIWKIHGKI